MIKSKSTVLLYSGGSYGTYLHWMLYALTEPAELFDPTTELGNSHNLDKRVSDKDYQKVLEFGFEETLNMPHEDIPVLARLHPKTDGNQSLAENVHQLLERIERVVMVYPNSSNYLLNINNYFYKIWDNIWTGPLHYTKPEDIWNNFPVEYGTPLDDVPLWIVREYISYSLFDAWENQVEWDFSKKFSHPKCHFVYVDDILYRPLEVCEEIKDFMGLTWVRDPETILSLHNHNMNLQKYLTQDQLSCNILKCLIEDSNNFEWEPGELSLVSEAWIQRKLREHGIDIQCHGVDQWPNSTMQLRKLLNYESI